jgi:hypothetical protein
MRRREFIGVLGGGMAFRRDAIPFGSMLFGRPLGNPAMSKDATWPSNIGEVIE